MHDVVPLELTLAPSRQLLRLAMLAHGFAIVLITLLFADELFVDGLSAWRGIALLALVSMLGLLQWWHRFRVGPVFVSGIRHDGRGWALRFGGKCCGEAEGAWKQARLLTPVFCHRHLVVLQFRCSGRWLPLTVAVTHDSCHADDFRRLRVLARHLPAPQLWASSR